MFTAGVEGGHGHFMSLEAVMRGGQAEVTEKAGSMASARETRHT